MISRKKITKKKVARKVIRKPNPTDNLRIKEDLLAFIKYKKSYTDESTSLFLDELVTQIKNVRWDSPWDIDELSIDFAIKEDLYKELRSILKNRK